jgi:hypothetical protein
MQIINKYIGQLSIISIDYYHVLLIRRVKVMVGNNTKWQTSYLYTSSLTRCQFKENAAGEKISLETNYVEDIAMLN